MTRLDDAIEAIDLEEWISTYAETKSGGESEVRVRECPQCGDDRFKLYVNVEKRLWVCYVCEWGRDLRDVVVLLAGISGRGLTDIRLEILAEARPARRRRQKEEEEESPQVQGVDIPGAPLTSGMVGQQVWRYAQRRGLTAADVQRFGLLAAYKAPTKRGNQVKGPWLVFPVRVGGAALAWQGRRLTGEDPKYLIGGETKQTLWPLDSVTEQLYVRQAGTRTLYLAEGVFDALGLQRMGLPALCTFGKSLSRAQEDIVRRLRPAELVLVWDADAAREVRRTAKRLPLTVRVGVVDLRADSKLDPGDALVDSDVAEWVRRRVGVVHDARRWRPRQAA